MRADKWPREHGFVSLGTKVGRDIGKRLKRMRFVRDWTQGDLAERAKLTAMTISHYETGRRTPSIANLIALAGAFTCSTDELLGLLAPLPGDQSNGD